MASFYVTLPSNVKNDQFENTVANFKTKLAKRIYLDGDWEVGLAGISYTMSWYNLEDDEWVNLIYFDETVGLEKKIRCTVKRGNYEKIDDLLSGIKYGVKVMTEKIMKENKDEKIKHVVNLEITKNTI